MSVRKVLFGALLGSSLLISDSPVLAQDGKKAVTLKECGCRRACRNPEFRERTLARYGSIPACINWCAQEHGFSCSRFFTEAEITKYGFQRLNQ
jgi:hypothetical protein